MNTDPENDGFIINDDASEEDDLEKELQLRYADDQQRLITELNEHSKKVHNGINSASNNIQD